MVLFAMMFSVAVSLLPRGLAAMEFQAVEWNGREVLLASGPIEQGDAKQYREALARIGEQPHGARVVLLDSPGGSVKAAMEMSDVNDEFSVHMVIPDGARCASACASILYISGDYRTTASGGLFGQHSCSRGGVPDPDCNELLALHAVNHGVAHGAVKAFVSYVEPEDILWFSDTDLDCHGVSFFPFSRQSGFERSEPCFFQMLKGEKPGGQVAWRVEMKADGYRAFARPVADDERDFEIGLFCDEAQPGQMFVEFDMRGPEGVIREALTTGYVILGENRGISVPYSLEQLDRGFTRAALSLPKSFTREVLTKADRLGVAFDVVPGYNPITSWMDTTTSREALLFVANHCVNRIAVGG